VGERPDDDEIQGMLFMDEEELNRALGLNSEFGFYPASAYVQLKAYF
jgi:hypothetical protein